ncbi:uncharacterized protein N0V89_000503 [Didymosphaeria variabile]|uniref:Uncharacterized protein n=1 Tax=Didymosphaeria variabile TaxID=1932322 RepID=A0A9W9CFR9_9PLEO|nr:uncharacterized protein N0V89_000503 [Didymosphaeria variabile]KAJ4359944.1 hypothetical protein N0V89_000503 [Didymosphaeria variabile]
MGDHSPEFAELDPDIVRPGVVRADKLPDPSTFELDIIMQDDDAESNGAATPRSEEKGRERVELESDVPMTEDDAQSSGSLTPRPTLQFLRSYLPLVDGAQNAHRAAHFNPSAMIKVNADPPLRTIGMNRFIPLLDAGGALPIQFSSELYRAWAITNTGEEKNGHPIETLLVD